MAGFSIDAQRFPTWHAPGPGLSAPGISHTSKIPFHQIFLGERSPEFHLSNRLWYERLKYDFSASRFVPRTIEEFGEALTIVAKACPVVALSPAHSHPTGLYLNKDARVGDGRFYISATQLCGLIGAVNLSGSTIIIDGCDNQILGPVFMRMGARAVYTHTRADFCIHWAAVLDNLIHGKPLPNGSDIELFH